MTAADSSAFLEKLQSYVGRTGEPILTRDPVNQPMIRHWCDAMSDQLPVYLDADQAAKSVHGQIVAPPAMLNAWAMAGLVPRPSASETTGDAQHIYAALDQAGFTSVVATNSEHEYLRYLRVGDHLRATTRITEVSGEKQTGLGIGHFVTSVTDYHTEEDERVGNLKFRILKFRPGTGRLATSSESGGSAPPRPRRPRPGISRDTQFFWDGIQLGELRIQRCAPCDRLFHPPVVRCPGCGSYELDYRVSSGRGTLYSFVEPVHPSFAAFDYPLVVGLVELEEGTRLLTNIVDLEPDAVSIGLPLELVCRAENSDLELPFFRPRRAPRRKQTLCFEEVETGQLLPPCPISITPTLIVAGAIASRDYQDVHHDRDLAVQRGSPDIFMNILTTSGLCARYITDWTGPDVLLKNLRIRLGAPNYPHDTMTLSGSVTRAERRDGVGGVELALRGYNRLGDHVTGTAELEIPSVEGASQ